MTQKSTQKRKSFLEEYLFLIFGIGFIVYGIILLIGAYINPGSIVIGFGVVGILVYVAEKYWVK